MPLSVPAQHHRQCIQAAYASRLNPNAISDGERQLLQNRVDESYFKAYLQIRNAILRLWTRNPLVAVTREEASQCTKERRHASLALTSHEWLARNGYINFGCVPITQVRCGYIPQSAPQRTIVIIGAGVAGLACARQISALSHQFAERWIKYRREQLPKIVVLEGRNRIGGRVYSHPLRRQAAGTLPHGLANTAELGAQIITGFEGGNPLDAVIRGQLALDYHLLKDNMILYDWDGTVIEEDRDARMQDFFIDIMEAASDHPASWKPATKVSTSDGTRLTLAPAQDVAAAPANGLISPTKMTMFPGLINHNGKRLRLGIDSDGHPPSLGSLMDQMVVQKQMDGGLSAKDLRVLNWHYANLEYGNAINVSELSLGGWDQDSGNEFDGQHSMVIGGYSQLVRGLLKLPTPLDVRRNKAVRSVSYSKHTADPHELVQRARITCTNGETISAHHVVSTIPLGVLHHGDVKFEPEFPLWKTEAVNRMGFGILNKIILVFDHVFWDPNRDMFGYCRSAPQEESVRQADYGKTRGRFYLFWNALKSSGRPMLVALLAGDAAMETEQDHPPVRRPSTQSQTPSSIGTPTYTNGVNGTHPHTAHTAAHQGQHSSSPSPSPSSQEEDLVSQVLFTLTIMFKLAERPRPEEAIITRWRSDPFARGSYSYLGPDAQPGDYEAMARPVGNLHFAGEATCGTHPATVHGAFLSGLRAAGEVVEAMIGGIPVENVK